MQSTSPSYDKYRRLTTLRENEFVFSGDAVEITIVDRLGRTVWKKGRDQAMEPIRWEGLDLHGMKVETGSYLCKIAYSDRQTYYVPFVFIKR